MKHPHSITPEAAEPSLAEMGRWHHRLLRLHEQISPRFARPEVRKHALFYLQAIISDIPRKNGWQIAEHARLARPYGIQRLLSRAVWDDAGVRADLRVLVCQSLSPPHLLPASALHDSLFPALILDESGWPKRGQHSAGVAHQYCGQHRPRRKLPGRRFPLLRDRAFACSHRLRIVSARRLVYRSRAPLGRSHPRERDLSDQAGIGSAHGAARPSRWVVADTVYGHCPTLRAFLKEQGYPYALAVPCTEVVCVQTPVGILLSDVASIARQALRARDWQRLSASLGTKGERLFDWARLPVAHEGTMDGRTFLVVRRCFDDSHELAYYLVWAPDEMPLSIMVQAIGCRWHIEEDLQACKALGLDQYEVRSYRGLVSSLFGMLLRLSPNNVCYSRIARSASIPNNIHLTLVLLAYAFLVSITVQARQAGEEPRKVPAATPSAPLIALTATLLL